MTSNLLILCLLSTIAILSEAQSNEVHCRTPANRNGFCVHIQNCETLYQIFTKNVLFPEDRDFLLRSRCGSIQAYVCCPPDATGKITTSTSRPITSTRRYTTLSPKYPPSTQTSTSIGQNGAQITTPRISAKKCSEYAEFAFDKTYTFDVLGGDLRVTKTSNCAYLGQALVVGGEEAKRREFPHMALIGYTIGFHCGGTLISELFVLSAGHCAYSNDTGPARYVRLGVHDIRKTNDADHIDFNIIDKIFHEIVDERTYNDIILFKLDREVQFDGAIRPACLPERLTVPTEVTVSGWGDTRSRGSLSWARSFILLKANVNTFSRNQVQQIHILRNYTSMYDDDSIVFAGHSTRRRDTCRKDSGGPLQFIHETHLCTYVVAGITSTGYGCARIGIPAIYVRVFKHLNWIEETVWPNE